MEEKEMMLKIENVSKIYKLGEIGGTTMIETLQRLWAKIRHKEDPTKKIGAKNYNKGEKFKALDNISFEVRKGERIGIIGHNGAGKSTLLKLISRVTGPTEGKIYLNGRVASMLEVGTGFNPELTGRENIYMNGAILGMTKKEIDSKIEDIIEFSEVRQFIDTPVKRYSSGMYVKLAFSVAAHLDSEIMIMDEVLAVGDMAFQNKCLNKMKEVSEQDSRTILYVSHNMNTIRQLCNRVIVLNHGTIIFDGNVEEGIRHYCNVANIEGTFFDLSKAEMNTNTNGEILMKTIQLNNVKKNVYKTGDIINFDLSVEAFRQYDNLRITITVLKTDETRIGMTDTPFFNISKGKSIINLDLDLAFLVDGDYFVEVCIIESGKYGQFIKYAGYYNAFYFTVANEGNLRMDRKWEHSNYGNTVFPKSHPTITED